ncbi:protein kinase [Labrys sp. LIt4]|uniref:protein kinase domain-containing protein n=1 Tax=Labrys sp. LIt4 TaxID=2821355 RepID=UPI001ADFCB9D|nr:protein kinase [Labrys sp. LIt4]MBP0578246.1 protein kinase [Labrys sp. LIt4]
MSGEPPPEDLEAVATRFAALWQALSRSGAGPRPPAEIRLLADRVRDALDRRIDRLDAADPGFIANSFAQEARAHEGALTEIHRLRHRDLGTLHALKTLRPDQADNVVARDLLLREAGFGARLRHRHVAAATAALRLADGRPALLMDWLPFSLSERMQKAPSCYDEILATAAALLSGLEAVHEAGLVHADLAPDNLLYDGEDLATLRIADFGIALEAGQRHGDVDLAKAGREGFSAPEQQAGEPLDGRADLYACGRILSMLLEGAAVPTDARDFLQEFSARLVHPDPDGRPASASIALAMLRSGRMVP